MRHDNVLRAIDNLQKSLLNFEEPSKMFVVSKRKADDGQYHNGTCLEGKRSVKKEK